MQTPIDVPWELFAFLASTAASLFAWFTARHSGTDKRVAVVENNLAVLSERVANQPTTREVAQLVSSLERTSGRLDVVSEKLDSMRARLDLHEGWLNRTEPAQ